jgi:hypothetical protein
MQVYRHPFFWGPRIRLHFIRSLSDYLERYAFLFAFDFNALHQRTVHPNHFCVSSTQLHDTLLFHSFNSSNPLVVAFEALSCRIFHNTCVLLESIIGRHSLAAVGIPKLILR